jgi:predicted nuclease of predicted toxin-antitoxin system
MRVLFDQGAPVPLRQFLQGHTVSTAAQKGWTQLQNSELLNAAEAAGFEVLVTTDQNLRHQQNLRGRRLAIVVLSTPR